MQYFYWQYERSVLRCSWHSNCKLIALGQQKKYYLLCAICSMVARRSNSTRYCAIITENTIISHCCCFHNRKWSMLSNKQDIWSTFINMSTATVPPVLKTNGSLSAAHLFSNSCSKTSFRYLGTPSAVIRKECDTTAYCFILDLRLISRLMMSWLSLFLLWNLSFPKCVWTVAPNQVLYTVKCNIK